MKSYKILWTNLCRLSGRMERMMLWPIFFTRIIRQSQNPNLTYKSLQEKMQEEVQDIIKISVPTFLQHVFCPRIAQVDIFLFNGYFTSSHTLDIGQNIIILAIYVTFRALVYSFSFLVEFKISDIILKSHVEQVCVYSNLTKCEILPRSVQLKILSHATMQEIVSYLHSLKSSFSFSICMAHNFIFVIF